MTRAILWLVFYTFIPALELRYSIPMGYVDYGDTYGVAFVVIVCILANIALAPIVWLFLDKAVEWFTHIEWIGNLYEKIVVRSRDRIHPYVERWGTLGLALFIGVPLPGSGVYSGALGAYVLGFRFRQFMAAATLGVIIAGSIVTAVVLSGATAFEFLLKQ